jgi:hypothetical protein
MSNFGERSPNEKSGKTEFLLLLMITVRLILESQSDSAPQQEKNISNWTEEQFANVSIINLNEKKIKSIDNLELFHEVKDLRLKGNQISLIENIEFLFQV